MASFNEVSAGGNVNVSATVGAEIKDVSRNGTSVSFSYRAYIYQDSEYWSSNSWALWVEGAQNTVFNSSSGKNHTSRWTKYYTGWYSKTITLGISSSSTTISIGVNGLAWSPSSPSGYVNLTLSGLPTVGTPTLSNISVGTIGDKSVYASFSVTNNNGQVPYSPHIEVATSSFSGVVSTIDSRSGTISGLDANRTYYIRGNDANDAGRAYTDIKSFTTTFTNPGTPGAPVLSYSGTEPVPNSTLSAVWIAATAGSTPIAGYRIKLYKNNSLIDTIDTGSSSASYNFGTFDDLGFEPGDIVKITIVSYSKDWNNVKHYNDTEVSSSNSITVISDKYIYVSRNGSSFDKYKMYISVNGSSFVEVKKEKFKVI